MSIRPPNAMSILLPGILTVIASISFAASYCDASDREYSCDCVYESSNETVLVVGNDSYNASADHFKPAIKSLQYCQGSFHCKPNFMSSQPSEMINTDTYIICFSDDSCLSNDGSELPSSRGFRDECVKNSCMYQKDLIEFNITNAVLEVGAYKCIKVGPEGLKVPYCLKPACKSFVAIEKLCVCNYDIRNCRCSSYCQNLLTSPSRKTYALFLSFGDVYTTNAYKGSFLRWIVLAVLCIGSVILLTIFYRICKAQELDCDIEVQNTQILRHVRTSEMDTGSASSSAAKDSFLRMEQSSPPPPYEEAIKAKCIEFKESEP